MNEQIKVGDWVKLKGGVVNPLFTHGKRYEVIAVAAPSRTNNAGNYWVYVITDKGDKDALENACWRKVPPPSTALYEPDFSLDEIELAEKLING